MMTGDGREVLERALFLAQQEAPPPLWDLRRWQEWNGVQWLGDSEVEAAVGEIGLKKRFSVRGMHLAVFVESDAGGVTFPTGRVIELLPLKLFLPIPGYTVEENFLQVAFHELGHASLLEVPQGDINMRHRNRDLEEAVAELSSALTMQRLFGREENEITATYLANFFAQYPETYTGTPQYIKNVVSRLATNACDWHYETTEQVFKERGLT